MIIFGSVIDGNITANSDIDILIIIDERDYAKEAEVRSEIIKTIFDMPFELHFASRDQFENWYKRFIERYEEV
jgi:predicted nucleotidyltransferase